MFSQIFLYWEAVKRQIACSTNMRVLGLKLYIIFNPIFNFLTRKYLDTGITNK